MTAARPNVAGGQTLSVRVLRCLVSAAEHCGAARSDLLAEASRCGVDLEAPDARVSRAHAYQLCRLAMELSGDGALGLHLGMRMSGFALNPLADLIAHAPSLREALTSLTRYHAVLSDHRSFRVCEGADLVTIHCEPPAVDPAMHRFLTEAVVVGLYQLVQAFARGAPGFERVCFEYAAPECHAEYAQVFGGKQRFAQPLTGLIFRRTLMDAPSPHADQTLYGALRTLAEQQDTRVKERSVAKRVRDVLAARPPAERPSMGLVARKVGLSERSLRRRLVDEGTSYGAIANEALSAIALRLLVDEQLSIQQTAHQMGFSNARAFHRAFKIWTGTTPRVCREAQLASMPPADG